uniref:Uncharacterized protein n=1 Tax=Anguilla anguilla TaxID=7936 RepID=A0A0E9WZ78_ANGAN
MGMFFCTAVCTRFTSCSRQRIVTLGSGADRNPAGRGRPSGPGNGRGPWQFRPASAEPRSTGPRSCHHEPSGPSVGPGSSGWTSEFSYAARSVSPSSRSTP